MSEARTGGGWAYGPQTPAVRRFLQRVAALRDADLDEAARRYRAAHGTPALAAADRALGQAVERTGREAERDAVVGPIVQLAHRPGATRQPGASEDQGLALLSPAAEAALAAALALIVRDVLDARAVATLYAPFADLIDPAALDDPAPR